MFDGGKRRRDSWFLIAGQVFFTHHQTYKTHPPLALDSSIFIVRRARAENICNDHAHPTLDSPAKNKET